MCQLYSEEITEYKAIKFAKIFNSKAIKYFSNTILTRHSELVHLFSKVYLEFMEWFWKISFWILEYTYVSRRFFHISKNNSFSNFNLNIINFVRLNFRVFNDCYWICFKNFYQILKIFCFLLRFFDFRKKIFVAIL